MSGFSVPVSSWLYNGVVASAGQLYVYQTGTTTKVNIYSDALLTTPLSNPVTLDANGQIQFYVSGAVNLRLDGYTSTGTLIKSIDPVYPVSSLSVGTLIYQASNFTLSSNNAGNNVVATAGITITLPLTNLFNNAFSVQLNAQGGSITLAPNAAEKIQGGVAGANYVIPQGSSGSLWTDALGNWGINYLNGVQIAGFRNRIINGTMQVTQRFAATTQTFTAGAALAYCIDRFYGYCTGANITGAIVPSLGLNRYRLTGAASNTGFGFGTRLEAANTADLAAGNGTGVATLSAKLSSSNLTTIGWAVYYATSTDSFGTLASPTRTLIASGNFTINSTEATYQIALSLSAAAFTGIEIVFTGGALLAAQTFTIGDVQFEPGNVATTPERRGLATELALCQRYYEKSFLQATAPAQNAGTTGASSYVVAIAGATNQNLPVSFKVTKRIQPTVTTYNPSAANAQPRNFDAGVDLSAIAAFNTGQDYYTFVATGNAGGTVGQRIFLHWAADAEL